MKAEGRQWKRALSACVVAVAASATALSIGACAETPRRVVIQGENNVKLARAATKKQQWGEAASRWHELYLAAGDDAHEACRETARALWRIGQPDDAKAILDGGLQRWPDDPQLLTLQGDLLADMGFRRAAEMSYAKSLEVNAAQPEAWLALARVRLELGLEEGARSACAKRLELTGPCRLTYVLLAEASASAGDFAGAYDAYGKAFSLAPGSVEELVTAGGMYQDSRVRTKLDGAAESSRVWLLQAIELDPQSTAAHYLLGAIAEDGGELDFALQHYTRAAETDPAYLPALLRLIELHGRRGERAQAETIARNAKKTFENDAERCAAIDHTLERALSVADVSPASPTR